MTDKSRSCHPCRLQNIEYVEIKSECLACKEMNNSSSAPLFGKFIINVNLYLSQNEHETNDDPGKETGVGMVHASGCVRGQSATLPEYLLKVVSIPAIHGPSAEKFDPFSSLPVELDINMQILMEIYFFYFPRKVSTMGPTSIWFPLAAADMVLLETTLFVCASYYGVLSGGSSKGLAIKHRGSLLRLINERLSDQVLGVTDGMICAVALLAGSEASKGFNIRFVLSMESQVANLAHSKGINGHIDDWKAHMVGLMRMVTLRGGFQNLGVKGMAVRIIAAAYSYGAVRSMAEYEFSHREDLEKALLSDHLSTGVHPRSHQNHVQGISDLFGQDDDQTRDMLQILRDLQEVAIEIDKLHFSKRTDAKLVQFDEQLTIIEYKLMALKRPSLKSNEKSGLIMQECCRLGAFLFTSVYLRDRPRSALVHLDVLTQLKPHLQAVEFYSYRRSQLRTFLWILFVGGTVALDTPDEAWFLEEIMTLLILIQLPDWGRIEASLQETGRSQNLNILSRALWLKVRGNLQTMGFLVSP